jgi:hypothetical protein
MQKNVYTVTMADQDEPLIVQTLLCDQVRAERELRQRGTGVQDAPVMFVSAIAWAALAREGRIGVKFDEFINQTIDVSKDEGAGDVDPTRPTVSNDSVSALPSPSPAPDLNGGSPV